MQDTNCSAKCRGVGVDLTLYSALLAIVIARDLTPNDQALLSTFLQSIGQNLAVISIAQSNCIEKNQNSQS